MKERRKAIDCRLVEASKSSPGYFKYIVTIKEVDGTVHKQPAYGKDMQAAIRRLVSNERAAVVGNTIDRTPDWLVLICWFVLMGIPQVVANITGNELWSQLGIVLTFAGAIGVAMYGMYLNKGR